MIYLHDSPVRFHGALHSANCLVDSRWVVKLADFGLREFKRGAEQPGIKDPAKVREKCYSEFTHKGNTSPGNQRIPIGPSGNLKFKCPHFRTNIFAASFCQNLHRAGSEVYSIFAKLISNVISIIIFHRLKHIFGWTDLLYKAPELLRLQDSFISNNQPSGTQKGDVYSFGIILYELHSRHGPFGTTELSYTEILTKIIHNTGLQPFRYSVSG